MGKIFLLADDDSDDTELFCEALEEVDPASICHPAANGKQVFDVLEQVQIVDIIFLDINMPVMTGWECLTKLKEHPRYKNIPVIMYSTSSSQREYDMSTMLGAIHYITKPHSFKGLREVLQDVVIKLNEGNIQAISKL